MIRAHLAIGNDRVPFSIDYFRIGGKKMKEKRRVLYKKGVFVCPKCRQSYVQDKWMEEWRIRCHKCDYRGTLTEVSVEEHVDEETVRH
jgi:hypothetical protein